MKEIVVCFLTILFAATGLAFEVNVAEDFGPTSFVRWPVSAIPVRYVIDSKGSQDAGSDATVTAINAAFTAWQRVTKQSLRFSFTGQTTATVNCADGINSLLWIEKNWPASSFILAVTRTTFLLQTEPDLIDADISFNGDDFHWSVAGGSGSVSIQSVAQHEIGHMIGFQHSQVQGAVMLPAASNITNLSKDDRAAIRFLYPSSSPSRLAAISPPKRSTLFDSSSSFPLTTFRWSAPAEFTNFVVDFCASSDLSPLKSSRAFQLARPLFFRKPIPCGNS